MKTATLLTLLRDGRVGTLLATMRAMRASYRVPFLAAAVESGILRLLARGPVSLDRLATDLGAAPALRDGLEAWLGLGVSLGELGLGPEGYRLRGRLARRLAKPEHDATAALVVETARLHWRLIAETPERLRAARPFTLADQDGPLVARSSRSVEPFVGEAVDDAVPARGALRLLEIGCGSGIYIRRAAMRNPELTALGLELQPDVAAVATGNMAGWGLGSRVEVEVGDVRGRAPDASFDLVTLHNNIYYFPVAERVGLLRHVRAFLRPGGRLLLTTVCLGKGSAVDILSLWGAMTAGCGRAPGVAELIAQMQEAGFAPVRSKSLIPGESFHAFVGTSP
jgi:SAM-dependent methyltransferase